MQVKLSEIKEIVTTTGETISVDTLTIVRIVDAPQRKRVRVRVAELPLPIVVLEGDEYREWKKTDIAALLEKQL